MEDFRIRLRHGLADLAAFEQALHTVVTPADGQVRLGSDTQNAAWPGTPTLRGLCRYWVWRPG